MTSTIEDELKKLILDDDFTSLQSLVNEEVNLMDILRVSHKELQHSNFLAWFFDPNGSHNLGDFALKEFIKIYFKENEFIDLGTHASLSVFDFIQLDFDDLEIRREYNNIDLVFISEKNKFCIVIENKIYANEQKGQLEKYRTQIENEYSDFKHKIYIYLSLEDQEISESERPHYVQLNYGHIIKLIEQILSNQRINLAIKTRFVFEQYLQTLKSMCNQNDEINQIAQQLYKKYKSAFDLVFKYAGPSDGTEICNKIQELINNGREVKPFKSNKTYIRFQPDFFYKNLNDLKEIGFVSPDDDLSNNWIFLFEFNVRTDRVTFDFKIGQGDQDIRLRLYEMYKTHPDIFNKVVKANGTLSNHWHSAFQKNILTPKDIDKYRENDDFSEIEGIIEEKCQDLFSVDLPKIINCFHIVLKDSIDKS